MKKLSLSALIVSCALAFAGCGRDDNQLNKAGLTEETYRSSGVPGKMTFPGGKHTVYKPFADYKKPISPQPFKQPEDTWMVYMAAPGWTNGGMKIEDRLATDAVAAYVVKQFLRDNHLDKKVKVAWLQYDLNPGPMYVEDLSVVPDNFIPLFLKPHGPQVDYYIYSPATRHDNDYGLLRYDQWLKPYITHAKKDGDDYVTANQVAMFAGFNDPKSAYWDKWGRHWFIVNPQGEVVDSYFSNLDVQYVYGADRPINSLIHHLKLDPSKLVIDKIVTANYQSFYTPPFWEQFNSQLMEPLGFGEKN